MSLFHNHIIDQNCAVNKPFCVAKKLRRTTLIAQRFVRAKLVAVFVLSSSTVFTNPLAAETVDAVQIALCLNDNTNAAECSQEFVKLCLDENSTAVEFSGTQEKCLNNLLDAWNVLDISLINRGKRNYQGQAQFDFRDFLEKWRSYDVSRCKFRATKFAPARRGVEQVYCELESVIVRVQFLQDDHIEVRSKHSVNVTVPQN